MGEVMFDLLFKQNERILSELRDMRISIATLRAEIIEIKTDLKYIHDDLQDIKERLDKAHV